jgi:arsenite methyltransferase
MNSPEIKTCCASLYESDFARLLLGESFHPGGLDLTARIGTLLRLGAGDRVLDVASGKGESAIFLAQRFGCSVVGLDYGARNVEEAAHRADAAGVSHLVSFQAGDAESMPFAAGSFDALICECAFCTFPDKAAAASEFSRVLRSGGCIGLSDLTRSGPLPEDLHGLFSWIACIADARPISEYVEYLTAAGFAGVTAENHDHALQEMVRSIQAKLLGAELMAKLSASGFEEGKFEEARAIAKAAGSAVAQRRLGYSVLTGELSSI